VQYFIGLEAEKALKNRLKRRFERLADQLPSHCGVAADYLAATAAEAVPAAAEAPSAAGAAARSGTGNLPPAAAVM
jgi:hypothetical protein